MRVEEDGSIASTTPTPSSRPSARASAWAPAPAVVVEPVEQPAHRLRVVAAVVARPGHAAVREVLRRDEVAHPQLGRVEAQLLRGLVHHPLDAEGRLGLPEAAVRPERRLVGRDAQQLRRVVLDPVGELGRDQPPRSRET